MIINQNLAASVVGQRPLQAHKGEFGRLLLIGGHYPYGGAIIMAALASVNSGAGLVTVATDQSNIAALHSQVPEAMAFALTDRDLLEQNLKTAQVILLGPGLADDELASSVFDLVLEEISDQACLILDGSALTLLANGPKQHLPACQVILTPHQMEWQRLSGLAIEEQTPSNNQALLDEKFPEGTILVAKGHQTQLYQAAKPDKWGQIQLGGPYQATAGMGDTLAGMIAAFVGQFKQVNFLDAVSSAVYLHSAIAQQLSRDHYVVLPTMISGQISPVMKDLSQRNDLSD